MIGIYKGSPDGRYRFVLFRPLDMMFGEGLVNFLMLNPSTADETNDDPTIQICKRLGWGWGYKAMYVTNLSPLRATDSRDLLRAGPEPPEIAATNLRWVLKVAREADRVILAYGTNGRAEGRDRAVVGELFRAGIAPWCLELTKDGFPHHPLYLRRDVTPQPFPLGDLAE